MNKIIKHNKIDNLDNTKILKHYKLYEKKDTLYKTKAIDKVVKTKILKTKVKSARAIKKIQEKNVRLAMYGLY